MKPKLEPSPIILEFLTIMRGAPILPGSARYLQGILIRAGVENVPGWARETLGLGEEWDLRVWERALVRTASRIADRTPLQGTPPVAACLRLGLAPDYLYRRRRHVST